MRATSAGPEGTKLAGNVYSVEEKEARELIAGGYAFEVKEAKPAPKPEAEEKTREQAEGDRETASTEASEQAAETGRGRARKTQ